MNILNIRKLEEGLYNIESPACMHCNETTMIEITAPQLWAMNNGAHAQEVLPDTPAEIRERFISGTCPTCWNRIFGTDEEEN